MPPILLLLTVPLSLKALVPAATSGVFLSQTETGLPSVLGALRIGSGAVLAAFFRPTESSEKYKLDAVIEAVPNNFLII